MSLSSIQVSVDEGMHRPVRGGRGSRVTGRRWIRWAWAPLLALWTGTALAGPAVAPLTVAHAWSRATAPGARVGVAYLEITNAGGTDTLVRIESPVARQVEMHSMTMAGGVMQMRELDSVPIPARGQVRFEPGGMHLMLVDLVAPLQKGSRIPLTLVFQHAGAMHVEALVQDLGSMSAPDAADSHAAGH